MNSNYDIIVVGGGHAGCEAAMAAANLGSSVLLISMDMLGFAKMSCNPAIGGIAKGQIVREIDALGGYTGLVTDASTLQFRMLILKMLLQTLKSFWKNIWKLMITLMTRASGSKKSELSLTNWVTQ